MKVGFISLGCTKNLIDTEMTIGLFREHQYTIVNDTNEAEIIVINTCGFIESAKQEAINTILEMAEYKTKGTCKYLIVMGCLVERYIKELRRTLPEVDLFIPIKDYDKLWEKIDTLIDPKKLNLHTTQLDYMNRVITTGKITAYLKIAEGCSNRCTYCAIPYIRGKYVSRPFEEILEEAKNLANKQKAIFLDRDGTINEYVGFLRKEEDFRLIPGVSEAIKKINNSGYLAIVVTNQPVIARGEVTEEGLEEIHKKMETLLGLDGAYIDDIYYCPHHPDKGFEGEIPELKIECDCRKPKTGMLEKAAREHNIDLSSSIMIGDSTLDIKMAENAGMQSVLLKTGQKGEDGKYEVSPTLIAEDLNDAINKIICKKASKKL